MKEEIKDKVAVVTGGSRGIGKAIALTLAENGAYVIICARNGAELQKTSESIKRNGGTCHYIIADISEENQVEALVSETLSNYSRIDILINNAGVGVYKPLVDSTMNDWNRIINTNLRGAFLCSRAFAPIMMKQKNGYIINIASGAGKIGFKNLSIYCASKFGLIGLTESLKKELREFGIEVLYLCPGYVRTGFFRDFPSDFHLPYQAARPEDIAKEVLRAITGQGKLRCYWNMLPSFKSGG